MSRNRKNRKANKNMNMKGNMNMKNTGLVSINTKNVTANVSTHGDFVELCKLTKHELKNVCKDTLLVNGYSDVISEDGFVYAKGNIPLLLTAHLDTVHAETVKTFYEENGNKIYSPQGIGGDDRCGVYMIFQIIKEYKPYILFCEDEEIGGVGSDKFCRSEIILSKSIGIGSVKYMIELDRANSNDAVFYDCGNKDFQNYICDITGYKKATGSFSDISNLSPETDIASVNLSCGYYNAHRTSEYVMFDEMMNTIEKVKLLIQDLDNVEQFDYEEERYKYGYGYYGNGYGYGRYSSIYDDEDLYENYYGINNSSSKKENTSEVYAWIFATEDGEYIGYGKNLNEAIGDFLSTYPTICWNDVLDYEQYEKVNK